MYAFSGTLDLLDLFLEPPPCHVADIHANLTQRVWVFPLLAVILQLWAAAAVNSLPALR